MSRKATKLDKKRFLDCYRFTSEEFDQAEISWEVLEEIYQAQARSAEELKLVGDYIASRLSPLPAVHSLKVRVKQPEHLVAKIIRKRLEKPEVEITRESYRDRVTDLVGVRALHLFKDQWLPIHEFVMDTWSLNEQPIAYVRDGDPETIVERFKESGCEIRKHAVGYRSVHYLICSQPAKDAYIAELQVRTLFEEAWSEIDHQVRYPRFSDNANLSEFLTIFNRLAGSADEMGTFIQALIRSIGEQNTRLADVRAQLEKSESQLQDAISQLAISNEQKESLQRQVSELRKSSERGRFSILGSGPTIVLADPSGWSTPGIPAGNSLQDFKLGDMNQRTCSSCGRKYLSGTEFKYQDGIVSLESDRCP